MAAPRNRRQRAARVYVNGKRADDQYALFDRIGQTIKAGDKAARRALSSTRRRLLTEAVRQVSTNYNIKSGQARERLRVQSTRTSVTLYAHQRRIPLVEFGGRWGGPSSAGATAQVIRGQTMLYPGTFMAKGRTRGAQTQLIYVRFGDKRMQKHGRYKGKVRQPIRHLYGPSVRNMIHGRINDPVTGGGDWHGPYSPLRTGPNLRPSIEMAVADYHVQQLRRLLAVELKHGGE